MVNQADFEAVIESFMMEMSAICVSKSEKELRAVPGLIEELRESAASMRAAIDSPAELLPLSFGMVDEFVQAHRAEVIRECYAHYLDMNRGQSRPNPQADR
jgi:hypothetical protein